MELKNTVVFAGRWLVLAGIIATLSGCASAAFLLSLDWITTFRLQNNWLIFGLPVAGALLAWLYKSLAHTRAQHGNHLIVQYIYLPEKQPIPWIMTPLIWFATLLTHLFGGSAGREGTAVQMAGSLSDQLSRWIDFSPEERRLLLMCGVAAGFASVFGTPIAGTIFALELGFVKNILSYRFCLPVLWSALGAHYVSSCWSIHHTHYEAVIFPQLSAENLAYVVFAAIAFGLTARAFVWLHFFVGQQSAKLLPNAVLRTTVGGVAVAVLLYLFGADTYAGLGIATIQQAFSENLIPYTFAIKLLLTCLTLGVGFKGGEVTPLFFIGATLGNALALFLGFPLQGLAALGFVSVFAAAAKTPLAGIILGLEVFGAGNGIIYWAIASVLASFVSGENGIYSAKK
jgi:H+/Cl- antiporter ClcA